jgi:putative oxidoreductase
MNNLSSRLRAAYVRFEEIVVKGRSLLLLLIRLYWGWQFAQSGWGKLANLSRVTVFFAPLHIPAPGLMALGIAALEFVGGILLILGLGVRAISSLLAVNMCVAFLLLDQEALKSVFSNPGKFYAAEPFTFLAASVLIAIFGAGMFSLDYLIAGKREILA